MISKGGNIPYKELITIKKISEINQSRDHVKRNRHYTGSLICIKGYL